MFGKGSGLGEQEEGMNSHSSKDKGLALGIEMWQEDPQEQVSTRE